MAYKSLPVDDLSCSVCHDIFKDPVLLSCGHSFCKGCLQSWWRRNQEQQCPLCKRRSSKTEPPRNIALKNLSEAFQQGNADLCPLHGEKLKLFCLADLEMVCLICRASVKHANHRFLPVDEAATSHREELQKLLKPQKETLNVFVETKRKCDQIAAYIKVQTAHTERQIQKEFEKLHQFLQDEKKSRITALRDEEQLKGRKMKKEIEKLSRQIETLSHTVTETEKQLGTGDISFLNNYKATAEKVAQPPPPMPALPKKALMDVAEHLGNLAYVVWEKLEEKVSYIPGILDPNTAGPDLHLSEDLTSVRCGARQQLPENPERLKYGVLGFGFPESGTYIWEVEVGDSTNWELGVSIADYGENNQQPENAKATPYKVFSNQLLSVDCCKIGLYDGRYKISAPRFGGCVVLPVGQKLQRIRMKLDSTTDKVFFIDPETKETIHSSQFLTKSVLFPYICSTDTVPLKISPVKEL